ncbi:hypothetical protein [Yersinia rohdei]|uniref:hypothetical protein n=1 Tax=Yersinia rohdei TaxID=29485 RepID=UPI0036F235DC
MKIKKSDIYRNALQGRIYLSIYFQSPIILRKIKLKKGKITLRPQNYNFSPALSSINENIPPSKNELTFSTEGEYFYPKQRVIDTNLLGYEFFLIQRLLAHSLKIPSPVTGEKANNHGITVSFFGENFQLFEKMAWYEKVKQQAERLSGDNISDNCERMLLRSVEENAHKEYFPIHELPKDACIVIRHSELKKLINIPADKKLLSSSSTRISTPLSRLFWLACKYNEAISPLITQPYKLLSIFEQWASEEGITDRFSGDTIKHALERGSPPSILKQK